MSRRRVLFLQMFFAFLALPLPAAAYIGPGAGLTAIGTVFAMIGAVFLLIVGFLWYPIKRLIRGRKKTTRAASEPEDDAT